MGITALKIPEIQVDWGQLKLDEFGLKHFANGARLYQIQTTKPGLCSFEIVFKNGRISEHKKLVSRMSANQIQEGSQDLNSSQVADIIDFYGANLSIHADLDFTVISMSCLQKHFGYLTTFLTGLILNPAYRDEDLQKAKRFFNSQLQHQLVEPDYVSYREFTAIVYGRDSSYGYNTTPEIIEALITQDLFRYQSENYTAELMEVFYCGDLNDSVENHLEQLITPFGNRATAHPQAYSAKPGAPVVKHFSIEHCAQISLKLGMRCIPKRHPDFYGLYVLNTILGDYFGSRLMKNLREDKGYTYDIHSTLDAQVHDGCFYISAELNPDQINNAIFHIREELNKLRTELIGKEELELVKNYICGNIMRHMDGPFQTMAFLKVLVTEYGSTEAFSPLLQSILGIDPETLRNLAYKYFDPEKMILVTAGAGG
jgi:predicted Zn-dependent peptidase